MEASTRTHTLATPITRTFKGAEGERQEQVTEVRVRKPLAGDLVVMDGKGEIAGSQALLAVLTDLSLKDIQRLEVEDFMALSGILQGFLPAGLTTGTP